MGSKGKWRGPRKAQLVAVSNEADQLVALGSHKVEGHDGQVDEEELQAGHAALLGEPCRRQRLVEVAQVGVGHPCLP